MNTIQPSERQFGYLSPYLIAEIGVNHEGSLERAKRMISAVARAGGHAAKFQTYKAEKLAAANSSPAYWDLSKEPAQSQFALFKRWDSFGPEDYRVLAANCEDEGIDFLSTPFDLDAVDMLNPLMKTIKVASADITNIPLLRKVAATCKPVIMSTGAALLEEVQLAVSTLNDGGAASVTLLHCVLNYPTLPENAQLSQIIVLREHFGRHCSIGYSDHVVPDSTGAMPALEIAALLGATVIEKHFTDDKSAPGNDHYHSMDEADLTGFTRRLGEIQDLYGNGLRDLTLQHRAIKNARRRIVAARDLAAGQVISESDIIALRSDAGIEVAHWDAVLGRQLCKPVNSGTPVCWSDLT